MTELNGKSDNPGETALPDAAGRVLENLAELEPALVSAGIFDREGNAISVTSEAPDWPREATELLAALEQGSGAEALDSAHVAGAEGEVFVVSEAGLSLVAVTERFVLASLASFDMRMALRDAAGTVGATAEDGGSGDA